MGAYMNALRESATREELMAEVERHMMEKAAADIEPAEQELTQAILEWDAAHAYGERVRYPVMVDGGSI